MKKVLSFFLLLIFVFPATAQAGDYTFAPVGCEFSMVFPEKPSIETICDKKDKNKCRTQATFNEVYDVESGIHIVVTCNDAEKGMYDRYNGAVMQYTLNAMAKPDVDKAQTAFQDFGYAKEAVVIGSKKQQDGRQDIYMSQLWIGKKSVLTATGQIRGGTVKEADVLFAHIMKSVRDTGQDTKKASDKPAKDTDKDAAPQKDSAKKP